MNQPAELQVLYADAALLVINKPAGLSTLPDGYDKSLPHVKSLLEPKAGRLWIVHRLDKETSGVLLLARSAAAHRSLNIQFEQRQVKKTYHALVLGDPDWERNTSNLPLRPNGDRQHRTVIDINHGKPAVTHFKVLERFEHIALVEAVPETGRTHQIRVHLYSLGLYIVGDRLYGPRKRTTADPDDVPAGLANYLGQIWPGIGLHSRSLEITHPVSGEKLKFEAPYPLGWMQVLQQLHDIDPFH